MFTLFLYSLPLLLVAVLIHWLMRKSPSSLRLLVAAAIWPGLLLAAILWVVIVGDQMPPDAVLIDHSQLEGK